MQNTTSHDFTVGAVVTTVVSLIPDELFGTFGKIMLAIVTAVCSGFAYNAGRALWERFARRKIGSQ